MMEMENINSLLRLVKKYREKAQLPILRGKGKTWLHTYTNIKG